MEDKSAEVPSAPQVSAPQVSTPQVSTPQVSAPHEDNEVCSCGVGAAGPPDKFLILKLISFCFTTTRNGRKRYVRTYRMGICCSLDGSDGLPGKDGTQGEDASQDAVALPEPCFNCPPGLVIATNFD